MASEKQITANRENGKLGGVKTSEGKDRVRFNALKHGLNSKHLLCALRTHTESQEQFEEILIGLKEALQPVDFFEEVLISKLAKVQFKMLRYETLETASFKEEVDYMSSKMDKSISVLERNLQIALKYKASLDREWSKTVEELQRHRHLQQLGSF